jgi:hypothetical protein
MLDGFLKDVTESAESFSAGAPYSHEKVASASAAIVFIDAAKAQVDDSVG